MLEVKDLICGYDSKFILNRINFRIEDGGLWGIIGPNGSGKTTLLRAMTKILKLRKGEVLFEGKNILKFGFREFAQKVAFVSQSSETGYNMTIEEFVLLGRVPYRRQFQFLESKHDDEISEDAMILTDAYHAEIFMKHQGQLLAIRNTATAKSFQSYIRSDRLEKPTEEEFLTIYQIVQDF